MINKFSDMLEDVVVIVLMYLLYICVYNFIVIRLCVLYFK